MNNRFCKLVLLFVTLSLLLSLGTAIAQNPAGNEKQNFPWMDRTLSPDERANMVLSRMTLDEKMDLVHGQGMPGWGPPKSNYYLGNGGAGFVLGVPRLGIPIIQMSDAAYGVRSSAENGRYSTALPSALASASSWDPEAACEYGALIGRELRAQGYNMTLGGGTNITREPRNGRTFEYLGEDPILAGTLVGNRIKCEQAQHVIGDIKHYAVNDQESGRNEVNVIIDKRAMQETDLLAFQIGIGIGNPGAVMCSYNAVNGDFVCENKYLLTDVLKERMGFDGLVIGDWNGHGQLPGGSDGDCPAAINAGIDMFMVPDEWRAMVRHTLAEVRSGVIPIARLDEAVRRVLRVKMRAGLFRSGRPSSRPLTGRTDLLGSSEHRALAREAVRRSLVLLKNRGHLIPLRRDMKVLVAGDGADTIGKQCGGWTISWQGDGNSNADFPGGSSIWDGIREAVDRSGGTATLSRNGSFEIRPDVAIVVYGEEPYAETTGDREDLEFRSGRRGGLRLLRELKAAGVPVVSVFLSGRPLWVNRELNASDSFVAAWLPGSEGRGVADALFRAADGSVAFDFTGRLSYSWPQLPRHERANRGKSGHGPLFPFGFGLGVADDGDLPTLPE